MDTTAQLSRKPSRIAGGSTFARRSLCRGTRSSMQQFRVSSIGSPFFANLQKLRGAAASPPRMSKMVTKAGLLDMLRLPRTVPNFMKTGKDFAINSFNMGASRLYEVGAALIPVTSGSTHRALMAATSSFIDQKIRFKMKQGPEPQAGLMPVDPFRQGRMIEKGMVYRQTFVIRSCEVGTNRKATIDTLTNLFQEVALNHVLLSGIGGDGFGTTNAMARNNLIWVVNRMHVAVETYPTWGDVVEIDSWVAASGKNGMRRDWIVRDFQSGEILARSTSTWVMMHHTTRKLSKIPVDVKAEISPYFLDRYAIPDDIVATVPKLDDTAEHITTGLMPRRSDLDMNHHVNNVKYLNWMIESVPASILDSHELSSITLHFRRECCDLDVIQSLASPDDTPLSYMAAAREPEEDDQNYANTTILSDKWKYNSAERALLAGFSGNPFWENHNDFRFLHMLRIQDENLEILRGKSVWRIKTQGILA